MTLDALVAARRVERLGRVDLRQIHYHRPRTQRDHQLRVHQRFEIGGLVPRDGIHLAHHDGDRRQHLALVRVTPDRLHPRADVAATGQRIGLGRGHGEQHLVPARGKGAAARRGTRLPDRRAHLRCARHRQPPAHADMLASVVGVTDLGRVGEAPTLLVEQQRIRVEQRQLRTAAEAIVEAVLVEISNAEAIGENEGIESRRLEGAGDVLLSLGPEQVVGRRRGAGLQIGHEMHFLRHVAEPYDLIPTSHGRRSQAAGFCLQWPARPLCPQEFRRTSRAGPRRSTARRHDAPRCPLRAAGSALDHAMRRRDPARQHSSGIHRTWTPSSPTSS